jgi:hypothetical protein
VDSQLRFLWKVHKVEVYGGFDLLVIKIPGTVKEQRAPGPDSRVIRTYQHGPEIKMPNGWGTLAEYQILSGIFHESAGQACGGIMLSVV